MPQPPRHHKVHHHTYPTQGKQRHRGRGCCGWDRTQTRLEQLRKLDWRRLTSMPGQYVMVFAPSHLPHPRKRPPAMQMTRLERLYLRWMATHHQECHPAAATGKCQAPGSPNTPMVAAFLKQPWCSLHSCLSTCAPPTLSYPNPKSCPLLFI